MKTGTLIRTIAGLSLAAAVVCGLTLESVTPASASGDGSPSVSPIRGIVAPLSGTMAPLVDPFVDLAITLVGQNLDGSPNIRISNLGNEDAGQFLVLQLSAPGERERWFPGLAAGQSLTYHDPSFPQDCGAQAELVIAKKSTYESNTANDILKFTPNCGPLATLSVN